MQHMRKEFDTKQAMMAKIKRLTRKNSVNENYQWKQDKSPVVNHITNFCITTIERSSEGKMLVILKQDLCYRSANCINVTITAIRCLE